jgi:hypothetical protein
MAEKWTARQWLDWLRHRTAPPTVPALRDCADALQAALFPPMADDFHNFGQLRRILEREEFTRDRVGYPGCKVRLDAADNCLALEWAIAKLSTPDA